jgi:hypothetical protein
MRPSAFLSYGLRAICGLALFLLWSPCPSLAVFTEQGATWLGGANYSGRSASLADIDNDGDLDLLFEVGGSQQILAQQLFRNNTINAGGVASNTFTNVTSSMLPSNTVTSAWSAAWGDYDGDGKVDVYIGQDNAGTPHGRLLRNTGSGFTDVSASTGLNDNGFAQNVAWVDINNDHLLDMVIGMEGPQPNQIYLQDATHHFAAVPAANGIQNPVSARSYGMAIGDADGDGDLDIYISPCLGDAGVPTAKAYYKNNLVESGAAKTLSFTDASYSNGTQNVSKGYGAEFVDFDNDGKLDLYAVGANGVPTKIYKNMGNGQFVDVDTITGHPLLSDQGTDLNGGKAIDYDNDGRLDLFFHDNLSNTGNIKLYHNDSHVDPVTHQYIWQFTDVTAAMGLTKTATTPDPGAGGYDGTWGDIDLDGDLDLINPNNSTHSGASTPERVYMNDASTNGNHWLYVKLHGPDWDTTGIGSALYATLNSGTPDQVTLRREANTNAGTFNQSDVPVHFGLGTSLFVDKLLIRWPDGTAQVLSPILANQYISVAYFPGDYNGDNVVDARDYIVWKKGFGTDFTLDDYTTWRTHFGAKLTPGSGSLDGSAVPEPAAMVMIGLGCVVLCASRRLR